MCACVVVCARMYVYAHAFGCMRVFILLPEHVPFVHTIVRVSYLRCVIMYTVRRMFAGVFSVGCDVMNVVD